MQMFPDPELVAALARDRERRLQQRRWIDGVPPEDLGRTGSTRRLRPGRRFRRGA